MNRDGGIAEHGFGARCSNLNPARLARFRIDHGIRNVPEVSLLSHVLDFIVTDGGLQKRVPVDQSLATIDLLFGKQIEKRCADCRGALIVECESGAVPVAAAAHPFELAEDSFLVLIFPLPDSVDQALAPDVMT